MIKLSLLAALVAPFLLSTPATAVAQGYDGAITAEILPGWRREDGYHVAAVRMVLKDGWKTYWRAPGDGGIPPRLRWSGSRNLGNIELIWPTPDLFDQNGMRSIGYEQEVVVPMIITPKRMDRDIKLNAKFDVGVCKDICVPETLEVSAHLNDAITQIDPRIAAAIAEQPYTSEEAGVSDVSCQLAPTEDGMLIQATIQMPSSGGTEYGVIETDNPKLWVAEASTKRSGNTVTVVSQVLHVDEAPFLINRSGVRITVLGHDYAVDINGCPAG